MKTVLIATDLSDAANNATVYGIEFAKTFHARVILMSAYEQVPVPVVEIPVIVTLADMHLYVQRQLTDMARNLGTRYNISIDICCAEGDTIQAIRETVKTYQADVVIVGLKKTKYHFRRLLGGTVTEMIRKLPVPLLVIPEEIKYTPVTTIALVNESHMPPFIDWHIMDALKEIAKRFDSKLYMVRVDHNHFRESYELCNCPFQLNRMLSQDPVFDCIESRDASKAITDFIEAYHINMIAMLPHKQSLLEKWFVDNTTRNAVFDMPIPLLILPEIASDSIDTVKSKRAKKYLQV